MFNIIFVLGTRPEAIKLAPLIKAFKYNDRFDVKVCSTGQHKEMLEQVLDFFDIKPDYELEVMKYNQGLSELTGRLLGKIEDILSSYTPDFVFVQGDTTTAFVGALSAFYKKIPVVHIEAGLRSFDKYSPFPEEINRILVGHIARYHFAPTKKAQQNLYAEGVKDNVYVVGNTVIDALFMGLDVIEKNASLKTKIEGYFDKVINRKDSKIILVTAHRRESFGKPFENMCSAIKRIAKHFDDVEIIYPVHLNPNVRKPVFEILGNMENIHLIEPLDYPKLIWIMNRSYIVVTDSGGIQEEAPALGKPVLVLRDVTERTEGIDAKTAKLVGTNEDKIFNAISGLLENRGAYLEMAKAVNPYGDGKTSERILNTIDNKLR